MIQPRHILDVAPLPDAALDHRATIWWGNVLLLVIESTLFALLIASYFYLWQNFEQWPPPRTTEFPVLHDARPGLTTATWVLVVSLLGVVPKAIVERACLAMKARVVKSGLVAMLPLGVLCIYLQVHVFADIHFRWNDNAYASVVWALLGLQLLHEVVATAEVLLMALWVLLKDLDEKHARDIRTTAVYWYWVAGMWMVLYAVIFWVPRLAGGPAS